MEIRVLFNDLMSTIERDPEDQVKLERVQSLQEVRDIIRLFSEIEGLKAKGMEAKATQEQLKGMMQNLQNKMQQSAQGQGGAPEQFTPANQQLT